MDDRFWEKLDDLVASSTIAIDRPAGSTHDRFPDFVYPLDYGYLEGTDGGDGSGIDVWLGAAPSRELVGALATVDLAKRDVELKLLLGCTAAEMAAVLDVHNQGEQAAALLVRGDEE